MKKPFVIGVSGGSGSGKTHFIRALIKEFPHNEVCVLSQDNYYHPYHAQPLDENGIENFDTPESFDIPLFVKDLKSLILGEKVQKTEYTFNNPNISPVMLDMLPAPVIVIEGIFIFYFQEICQLLDFKIFIEASEKIKLDRRISRDQNERGHGQNDVVYRYENHVTPSFEKYIKPLSYEADIILPNNHNFDKALEMLIHYLKFKIVDNNIIIE